MTTVQEGILELMMHTENHGQWEIYLYTAVFSAKVNTAWSYISLCHMS